MKEPYEPIVMQVEDVASNDVITASEPMETYDHDNAYIAFDDFW